MTKYNKNIDGPIIEFSQNVPNIVSAGHDGFCPYDIYPFDEVYIFAYRWSDDPREQSVEIWMPYNRIININNIFESFDCVKVHRSGILWHDRTRDIFCSFRDRWLSIYGFTEWHPSKIKESEKVNLFTALPGSPMEDYLPDLLISKKWKDIKDFHTRHRDWMQRKDKIERIIYIDYERDAAIVAQIKKERGTACQICGFSFKKRDGDGYCEVHHLESLANGGLDAKANMLVVCANCHRQFHYGNVFVISHTATRLVVSIDGKNYYCKVG